MKELLLKKLRKQKGLSQEWIAQNTHVVRQTVSKWETGSSSPDAEELLSLSSLLGVSLDQLFGSNDEHPAVLGRSEHTQPHKDNCPAAVKKEEMITSISNIRENKGLLSIRKLDKVKEG